MKTLFGLIGLLVVFLYVRRLIRRITGGAQSHAGGGWRPSPADVRESDSELHKYLATFTGPSPRSGMTPIEVVWKDVGSLDLAGTRLCIGDSWCLPGDGVFVDATPGRYEITAECFSYGGDARVARLRVQLAGSAPDDSEPAGEFPVDVASAGVTDGDAIEAYADANPDDHDHWAQSFGEAQAQSLGEAGVYPHPAAGTAMVYAPTGFGDGTYAVRKLTQQGRPVGLEAVFLEPNRGYFSGS